MAAPADRVQLSKRESVAGGGDGADTDEFLDTLPLEPNEDAPEVQGLFLQPPAPSTSKDEQVYVTRDDADGMLANDAIADNGREVRLQDLTKVYTVTQTAHGITLTNNVPIPVYRDLLNNWVPAQADDKDTLKAAFVIATPDANTLVLQGSGTLYAPGHGLVLGNYYYTSQTTAGALSIIEPLTGIEETALYVIDADRLLLMNTRPVDLFSIQKYQASIYNTNIVTNLNISGGGIEVPFGTGTQTRNDAGFYGFSANGIVSPQRGRYLAKCNLHLTSNVVRANLLMRFAVNGVVQGGVAANAYIRGAGHNNSSLYLEEDFILNPGDVLSVFTVQEASAGTVTMAQVGSSFLKVVKQ